MDVVYILGNGSNRDNEEIRLSIRSLTENMLDIGDIYIVGELPRFLKNVKHIPAEDRFAEKWKNAMHKTRLACEHPDISEQFLLMNDDFFASSHFLAEEWPFYALKGSDGGPNGQHYFGIHCPIVIQKNWYLQLPLNLDMSGTYSPRSFYCNFYRAKPNFINDVVVRPADNKNLLDEQVGTLGFFSIANDSINHPVLYDWLLELYPTPSKFEC